MTGPERQEHDYLLVFLLYSRYTCSFPNKLHLLLAEIRKWKNFGEAGKSMHCVTLYLEYGL